MGWFWADAVTAPVGGAPRDSPTAGAVPPPGCPMHAGPSAAKPPSFQKNAAFSEQSCPVKSSQPTSSSSTLSKLNPLNYMPSNISQSRAANQKVALPTERTTSSIPRGDAESNWEYPSPQQMYNAMLRKGYDDTPEDAVESMVAVHNFLNEGAWAEIVEWERRFAKGLLHGMQACSRGEEPCVPSSLRGEDNPKPRLVRFQGRPNEMTPKAKLLQAMGQIYPSGFYGEPPFDRHDWYVLRVTSNGQTREVRYVIDYYSGPPEPTGEPVFYLDVRPAVDRPSAAIERLMRWGGDVWHRASGASVRENASS